MLSIQDYISHVTSSQMATTDNVAFVEEKTFCISERKRCLSVVILEQKSLTTRPRMHSYPPSLYVYNIHMYKYLEPCENFQ